MGASTWEDRGSTLGPRPWGMRSLLGPIPGHHLVAKREVWPGSHAGARTAARPALETLSPGPHPGPRQPPAVSALGCQMLSWRSLAGVSRPCPSPVLSLSRVPRLASGCGLGVWSPLGQGPTQTPAGARGPLSRQLRGPERTWGRRPAGACRGGSTDHLYLPPGVCRRRGTAE